MEELLKKELFLLMHSLGILIGLNNYRRNLILTAMCDVTDVLRAAAASLLKCF